MGVPITSVTRQGVVPNTPIPPPPPPASPPPGPPSSCSPRLGDLCGAAAVGAIVGIILGCIVLIALIAALILCSIGRVRALRTALQELVGKALGGRLDESVWCCACLVRAGQQPCACGRLHLGCALRPRHQRAPGRALCGSGAAERQCLHREGAPGGERARAPAWCSVAMRRHVRFQVGLLFVC